MRKIYAKSEAYIVETEDDKLYSWGWNEHGNLGLGDKLDRNKPCMIDVMFDSH